MTAKKNKIPDIKFQAISYGQLHMIKIKAISNMSAYEFSDIMFLLKAKFPNIESKISLN